MNGEFPRNVSIALLYNTGQTHCIAGCKIPLLFATMLLHGVFVAILFCIAEKSHQLHLNVVFLLIQLNALIVTIPFEKDH